MRKELLNDLEDVFVIHGFLLPAECEASIARTEAMGYEDAPINTFSGPAINKQMRNNDRVMIDDPALAARLWERLEPFIPQRRGNWQATGLNERFRFYRYDPGQQFDWHFDGHYERSPTEQSAFTFMVYLNEGCGGGATEFDFRFVIGDRNDTWLSSVVPETGMALVFVHRILHRGAPVTSGRKYVLRSDVMYRWAGD